MTAPRFLPRQLPPNLAPLADALAALATDLRWTWSHAGDALWKMVDAASWERTENPHAIMQNLTEARFAELDGDPLFKKRLQESIAAREAYNNRSCWYHETLAGAGLKGVAYFSLEFGLGEALPLYAGGLGVLAGDFLKTASDLAVPVTGVGLLYREGYFRQALDANGWQQEIYPANDSADLPLEPVEARGGGWLHVAIEFPGRRVQLRVWRAQVGRVSLYLLDSNDPLNNPVDQGITSKLYSGGDELRLAQEIALGVGGWRLIEALGLEIDVCHLNEGHAAFVTLERARAFMDRHQVDFWQALWATRAGNVFTTHTPVAAAFDTYDPAFLARYGSEFAAELGAAPQELAALGRENPDDASEPFNLAYLAARTCGTINGVSQLHGEVSRRIFQALYPRWPRSEVPVTHVTNGVHVPSWDSPWADEIWTDSCGKSRWLGGLEAMEEAIGGLSDEKLWSFRGHERADLVDHARRRLVRHLGQRGAGPAAIAQAEHFLDPNTLTLGFARRFTEYKRPNLLLHDASRLVRLLTRPDRPVQIIVAGKAHPADLLGKQLVQAWARFAQSPEIRSHAVFLEDYDIALAQEIVQGVDVWINTPRRPWEACGTSGMKVLVNGGLNLSVLDGWWAEAWSNEVGWALGDGEEHNDSKGDAREAEQLYQILEDDIVPMFYDRDASGVPRAWVARLRKSMAQLAPRFSANRMVRDYVEKIYLPASAAVQRRCAQDGKLAKELVHWAHVLRERWAGIHIGHMDIRQADAGQSFDVQVYLDEIPPEFVQVQLYAEPAGGKDAVCLPMQRGDAIAGAINGFLYHATAPSDRAPGDFTARVMPYHPDARIPNELELIYWQR